MENYTTTTTTTENLYDELLKIDPNLKQSECYNPKKTPKQKLLNRIDKEIKVLSERTNLNLYIDDNGRKETDRFWKHLRGKDIGMIDWGLKYKNHYLPTLPNNKLFNCKNDKELLVRLITKLRDLVNGWNDDNVILSRIKEIDDMISEKNKENRQKKREQKNNVVNEMLNE